MQKIQIGRTAIAGFSSFFGQFGSALRIAWVPLVMVLVVQAAGLWVIVYAFIAARGSLGDGSALDDATRRALTQDFAADFLLRFGWLGVVMILVTIAAYLMLVNGWLRHLLRGDELGQSIGLFRFGKRELKALLAGFLLMILIPFFGFSVASVGSLLPKNVGVAWMIVTFVLYFAVILAVIRLYLVFPMIALDQGIGWRTAWRLTKGNSWRLFWTFFLAGLLLNVLFLVVFVPVGLTTSIIGSTTPESITFGLVIQMVIYGVVYFVSIMILLGSLAEAYRQLGGPGIGIPEADLAVFDD